MRRFGNRQRVFITCDSANEKLWKIEVRRRLAEIESGAVKAIDGDEVSARIGQIAGR